MRKLAAAAAVGTVVVVGLVGVSTTAQAAEECRGRAATLVGTGGSLTGTPGDDVIVAHGASVQALAGNDLICADGAYIGVAAGAGDDVVDATGAKTVASVELGAGDDTYHGGPGEDRVYGAFGPFLSSTDPEPKTPDVGTDTIETGSGPDVVHSGSGLAVNHDVVDVGAGADDVRIVPTTGDGALRLGSGDNTLTFLLASPLAEAWRIDAQQQVVTHETGTMPWTGTASAYTLISESTEQPSSLVFSGTSGDDDVTVLPYPSSALRANIGLKQGDDDLFVQDKTADGSRYVLGRGGDRLILNPFDTDDGGPPSNHTIRVDLPQRHLDYGTAGPTASVAGVETLEVSGIAVEVAGTAADESIRVQGCRISVRAGGGDDIVRRGATGLGQCDGKRTRVAGGPGRDTLVGQPRTDDVLVGGRGYDVAKAGRGGHDSCRAEVMRGCERALG